VSKDLPLWEDDESDVKLEYRLQSGHALISTSDIDQILKNIRAVFKCRKAIKISNEAKFEWLPQEQKKGVRATVLNDDKYWHFIIAIFDSTAAIFAPHFLFFNSAKWIKLGRKLKVHLAYVHQLDLDSFGYTVFMKGKRVCSAHRDQSGVHQSKMTPMEFYLDGKLIYKADDEKDKLTEDTLKFISEDVLLELHGQGQAQFKVPLTKDEFRQPTKVRHLIFKARPG